MSRSLPRRNSEEESKDETLWVRSDDCAQFGYTLARIPLAVVPRSVPRAWQ